ncbi:MAG TPA: hypothetical protein VI876_05715 [Dehalococcoidia bacterium]|nr:hypothetical protein [Dehalococcoidia bacterium]
MDKLNTLSNGEKLIAGGGVLMLIASFLPWYKYDFSDLISVSRNGWQSPGAFWSLLAVVIGVAMAVAILGPKFANLQLPDLGSVTWPQAHLGLGVAALVFIILKFINESSYMSFGFYLGIIAAIALAVGGYLYFTEHGGKLSKP